MARSFLGTSALVKYYHPEEGTGAVTQFVEVREGPWRVRQAGKKRVHPYRVFARSRGGEGEAGWADAAARACWAACKFSLALA